MHFRAFSLAFIGTALVVSLINIPTAYATTDTFATPGAYLWTVPTGVTSADIEVWGGGGGGNDDSTSCADRGGGGGAYSKTTSVYTPPGTAFTVIVGAGGAADNAGETSIVMSPHPGTAAAAVGGSSGSTGAGGAAASGIGTIKYSGGDSATLSALSLMGSCTDGAGNAGTGPSVGTAGGTAPSGGGNGGTGGSAINVSGTDGSAPGGGGGGGGGGFAVSGAGGAGRVVFTYSGAATVSVAGSVYSDEGTTALASKTIAISINGAAAAGTAVTNGSGAYSITGLTISAGDVLTLYIDGSSEDAVTTTIGPGSNMTGIDLYQNRLIVRYDNSGSLTNANLATADNNGDADISALYSVSGSALTVASGKELIVPALHTFAPGGDVTTPTLDLRGTYTHSTETVTISTAYEQSAGTFTSSSGAVDINGTFTLSGGTFHEPSGTFSVFGNWAKTGGTLHVGNTTVIFDGSSGTQAINSGGTNFYSISHTGAGTLQIITNTLTLDSTFSNSAGTFDTNGLAMTSTGITVSGGTFTGSSGTVDINGTLTLSSGTFTAPSATMTVSGDWTKTGGTFTANSGTVHFDGTNQALSGSTTFHHFIKRDSENSSSDETMTFEAGSTQTITGTWTLDGVDGNDRISLVSSLPGTQWNVDPQGTRTIDYIKVIDSKNTNQLAIACTNNCHDGGNNTKWTFPSAPKLVSFSSSTADGTYGPKDTINITATYNEALDDPSSLTVVLDNGVSITLRAVQGSTLTGMYTVGAFGSGEDTKDLTVSRISSESVRDRDGGTVQSASSLPENADNIASSHAIVVDTTESPAAVSLPSSPITPQFGGFVVALPGGGSFTLPSGLAPVEAAEFPNIVPEPELQSYEPTRPSVPVSALESVTSGSRKSNMFETILRSPGIAFTNVVLAGLAAVSVLAVSSALISSIPSVIFQVSQASRRMWQAVLSIFGFNRVRRPWGRILDAETGNPIAGAYVQVYDHQGKQLKDTMVSNERGAFSVIIPPGTYEFRVQKSGWELTPKAPFLQLVAGEYVFDGAPVVVSESHVLPLVIAMRITQEQPTTKRLVWRRAMQGVMLFVSRLSWPLLLFGAGLNSAVLFVAPTAINTGVEIFYLVLIVWKIALYYILRPSVGYVRDAVTREPLDLALVRLYDAMTSRLIETRTTSRDGKFLLLPPLGVYTIMVVRAGYEPFRESHVVIDQKKESLDLFISLQPVPVSVTESEVLQ
ncbi:MAG: carboxypeptidase regulatory-like domain-containing protein [bacterium]|nr:carboxypeptidase regulatory-like domain-containing protein [bacterium]